MATTCRTRRLSRRNCRGRCATSLRGEQWRPTVRSLPRCAGSSSGTSTTRRKQHERLMIDPTPSATFRQGDGSIRTPMIVLPTAWPSASACFREPHQAARRGCTQERPRDSRRAPRPLHRSVARPGDWRGVRAGEVVLQHRCPCGVGCRRVHDQRWEHPRLAPSGVPGREHERPRRQPGWGRGMKPPPGHERKLAEIASRKDRHLRPA